MSLGDYLRLLRAKAGGITPLEIETATGLSRGVYRLMEQRYRAIGDDESVRLLADYYGVQFGEMRWRLDWPRKALSRSLVATMRQQGTITLYLWNEQTLAGRVKWWDLGAVGVETAEGDLFVVQRHAVERWETNVQSSDSQAQAPTESR